MLVQGGTTGTIMTNNVSTSDSYILKERDHDEEGSGHSSDRHSFHTDKTNGITDQGVEYKIKRPGVMQLENRNNLKKRGPGSGSYLQNMMGETMAR